MQKILLYGSLFLNLLLLFLFFYIVQSLGGWTFLKYRMNNRGLGSEYDHRKSLYEKMPINQGDILFLGNSLTAQGNWAELLDNSKIKNRGIAGDTSDGLLARLEPLLDSLPSQIFLMIGVNDLLFHQPTYVIENYNKIVKHIRRSSPETLLYVYSILPVNPKIRIIPIENEDIQQINQAIQKIALDNDLIYIDLHSHFANKDGALFAKFTSDGIHLNGEGYFLWKKVIETYLK